MTSSLLPINKPLFTNIMEELHEMSDVISNHMGTVKQRQSVQMLSKPQPDDSPPAKLALGHDHDADQSVAHSTEPRPLAEDEPRVVPLPSAVFVFTA